MSRENPIREFFLLEHAIRQSSSFSPEQLKAMRAYHDGALSRLQSARDLRDLWRTPVALKIYRDAAVLSASAILASKNGQPDDTLPSEVTFDRLEQILAQEGIERPPEYERAKPMLIAPPPLGWDRLPESEVAHKGADLEAAVRWLTGLIDPRSPGQFRALRSVRVAAATVALVALLALLGNWIFSPRNIALGKPVIAEGSAFRTTPEGAVDGDKTRPFGFHSLGGDHDWLSIDLERPYVINQVKVFGRGDCCFEQSIPLALAISDDGVSYRKVAERGQPFSQLDPWVIRSVGIARYVRLQVERQSVLVLREVEVYGRKVK